MPDGKITAKKCSENYYSKKYGSMVYLDCRRQTQLQTPCVRSLAYTTTVTKYFIPGHLEHLVIENVCKKTEQLSRSHCWQL